MKLREKYEADDDDDDDEAGEDASKASFFRRIHGFRNDAMVLRRKFIVPFYLRSSSSLICTEKKKVNRQNPTK